MSKLANMTGAPRTDVVPGFILSPLRLREYGILESSFERWHVARTWRNHKSLPPDERMAAMKEARAEVKAGEFTIGMPGYYALLRTPRSLHLLMWLMLRVKHPQVTRAEALEHFEKNETRATTAIFDILGLNADFDVDKKKPSKRRSRSPGTPPTNSADASAESPPPNSET